MTAYETAVKDLLTQFAWNPWFTNSYWPENEPRVKILTTLVGAADGRRLLEVGCANGYLAYLFARLGFSVSACDAYDSEHRTSLFASASIGYTHTNLNALEPLAEYPDSSFEVVILGEVFEHILNHPAGLLRSIRRVLKPGGQLLLTTPNPSTLANALRVLRDRDWSWGTAEFLRLPKFTPDGGIIDKGEIHYREYPAHLVAALLKEVGFSVASTRYVGTGSAPTHSRRKRLTKGLLRAIGLFNWRPLAAGYVIDARASQ